MCLISKEKIAAISKNSLNIVQSWTDRMYDMMDAEYSAASLYFIFIVIIMNFWLINLFIAVITEMFAKVREDSQHSAFTSSK